MLIRSTFSLWRWNTYKLGAGWRTSPIRAIRPWLSGNGDGIHRRKKGGHISWSQRLNWIITSSRVTLSTVVASSYLYSIVCDNGFSCEMGTDITLERIFFFLFKQSSCPLMPLNPSRWLSPQYTPRPGSYTSFPSIVPITSLSWTISPLLYRSARPTRLIHIIDWLLYKE